MVRQPAVAGRFYPEDREELNEALDEFLEGDASRSQAIGAVKDYLPQAIGQAPGLKAVIYGAVLIAFVLFEPLGLYGRWLKVRTYLQLFPFYRKGLFKRQKAFQKSDRLR